MPPDTITLRQLFGHWQSICSDYTEREMDRRTLELSLDELGNSIGYYAQIVPQNITVPAPADWGE